MLGSSAYAGVNCTSDGTWQPGSSEIYIDMKTGLGAVPPGTLLGTGSSGFFSWKCNISGSAAERTIWFHNQTPQRVKDILLNSGVRLFQDNIYTTSSSSVEITQPNVPALQTGTWGAGSQHILFGYSYRVIRGTGELKSFDTGMFTVGYHSDYVGKSLGDSYQARIYGKLIDYCPAPIVRMSDKVIDFKELESSDFDSGKTVKENFSLDLVPDSSCNAALEVSVAFQSNNGVVNNKYIVFNNGLQATITDRTLNKQVIFDQYDYKGAITQEKPGYFPYTVELSRKNNEPIKPGQFSNTVNILFTYR